MGGSRGSAAIGGGGFSSRGSIGIRSGPAFGSTARFGVGFGTALRPPFFGPRAPFVGFRQPFFRPRPFRNRIFFSTFSPGFFGYYGYPAYYGSDFYSSADYYPAYDYYGSSYEAAQNDVMRQQQDIDRLEDEVAQLREQRDSRQAAPPKSLAENQPSTPTLLVFRDKHTQEVQNYAIVGGTLWIFNEQRATKLPLSWLDIEATTKANEDRGVDFQIPKDQM
jgi:hypothetical protein